MLLSQQHTHATRCFPKPITLSCSENPNKRQLLSQYQLARLGGSRGGSSWSLTTREQCPQRGSSRTRAGDPGSRRGPSPRQAAQSRWWGQGSTRRELRVLLSPAALQAHWLHNYSCGANKACCVHCPSDNSPDLGTGRIDPSRQFWLKQNPLKKSPSNEWCTLSHPPHV